MWADTFGKIASGISNIGSTVLGYQTQKAGLEAARFQLRSAQAASSPAPAPAPVVTPYIENVKETASSVNPMTLIALAAFAVVIAVFALRKG